MQYFRQIVGVDSDYKRSVHDVTWTVFCDFAF